ncbi:hypothetical protein A4D02_09670 [Niastella koreensis]|uniref:Cupin 2 conserved barrel domain protein n=2 Tax=Niastella koreensis TaxID=354356 RepID=G8TNA4_NIAKG|nr:cupin domain-containing protein [Niastella koreensis]AEV98806.1 Cupin 2 conserved barrel domain protein [Niastella koreensis GR20-10]OQP43741.1 hypothetical protein A4D02_09670 [Niastella koreensis]
MAKQNEQIQNKVTGEKITWLKTAANTNGAFLQFKMTLAPGGYLPVKHLHPNQQEQFTVKKGLFKVESGKQERFLKPGDSITIEKGKPHRFWNALPNEETELEVKFTPALNTEVFLEQFFGLSNDDKTKADGTPAFLQLMSMANTYEIYVAGPPLWLQKVMGVVLGGIGRLLGYKKYYKKYSSLS